ncbi:MAG: histidine phosphotransferase family protein [Defluviicoccus sp.]
MMIASIAEPQILRAATARAPMALAPMALTPTDSSAPDDVQLAQMLCARLCHDLMGPAGAITIGLEFLSDGKAETDETLELIAASARQVRARLTFFRTAFAMASAERAAGLAEARSLIEAFLHGSRVALEWHTCERSLNGAPHLDSADLARLLLCLVLVAREWLPRGGTLAIDVHERRGRGQLRVAVRGAGARVADTVQTLLSGAATEAAPGVRSIHAYYLRRLLDGLDLALALDRSQANLITLDLKAA